MNVLTRTAFIGIIAVGMCFVIISGGIDLSVGSMAALIAGCVILLMNAMAPSGWLAGAGGRARHGASRCVLGAVFGLAHGLLITRGPHRALHRHARHARHLPRLPDLLRRRRRHHAGQRARPTSTARCTTPACSACRSRCGCSCWWRWPAALILNRTAYGRYVQAIGSNEQVARYAAVDVDRDQGADLHAARRLRRHRHAAVRAAARLGLADHRAAVGAGGDRRGDRRRHRAARAAPAASPAPWSARCCSRSSATSST